MFTVSLFFCMVAEVIDYFNLKLDVQYTRVI